VKIKYCQPHKTGGPDSKSWEVGIPSYIVKDLGIDETTGFIVEHDDNRIIFSLVKLEKRNSPVGFGVETLANKLCLL
jgi:hypothetical protein